MLGAVVQFLSVKRRFMGLGFAQVGRAVVKRSPLGPKPLISIGKLLRRACLG